MGDYQFEMTLLSVLFGQCDCTKLPACCCQDVYIRLIGEIITKKVSFPGEMSVCGDKSRVGLVMIAMQFAGNTSLVNEPLRNVAEND